MRTRIIPAYAGSTTTGSRTRSTPGDHPRIRGEHSAESQPASTAAGSSPHTRGAHGSSPLEGDAGRIIPAYAGSTLSTSWGGPHQVGSSPHTRGALDLLEILPPDDGIIPAYAGSTPTRRRRRRSWRDHPRIRGEHGAGIALSKRRVGSSPHTRGAPRPRPRRRRGDRIIPAYAGSTRARRRQCAAERDHPRIRGEHSWRLTDAMVEGGSSPHTRGALRGAPGVGCAVRIIPAYAGSTTSALRCARPRADHPRIRGEHSCMRALIPAIVGSSPHTRGAPQRRQVAHNQ